MRHALGLRGSTPTRSKADDPSTSTGGSQPPKRRFVRDGEVPVTVIRRDYQPDGEPGTNQLDAARQAIRAEAMARERAERSLEEAQVTIRDLQTKLAHERLAKDEALEGTQRAATEKEADRQTLLTVQAELVAERLALRNTEDALADALEGRHEAEGRLREGIADATKSKRKASAGRNTGAERYATGTTRVRAPEQKKRTNGLTVLGSGPRTIQARRRERPAKAGDQESKIVEWWKPRKTVTDGANTISGLGKRGRGRPKGSKNRRKP
jgi:hypothetical protein